MAYSKLMHTVSSDLFKDSWISHGLWYIQLIGTQTGHLLVLVIDAGIRLATKPRPAEFLEMDSPKPDILERHAWESHGRNSLPGADPLRPAHLMRGGWIQRSQASRWYGLCIHGKSQLFHKLQMGNTGYTIHKYIYGSTKDTDHMARRGVWKHLCARDQIVSTLRSLIDEKLSITVAGHSFGASLAILCAYDMSQWLQSLRVLTVVNPLDVVTKLPGSTLGYVSHVGVVLEVVHTGLTYLKHKPENQALHNLQLYLHLIGNRVEPFKYHQLELLNKCATQVVEYPKCGDVGLPAQLGLVKRIVTTSPTSQPPRIQLAGSVWYVNWHWTRIVLIVLAQHHKEVTL
ncbi:hypothetical protein SELMODRAFT_409177 [Selaginella moellendorffii]|uniref:Phospholipase A1 n=1 Tax=Selaginella moellendorffii TaxID=88036 RepID=D8RAL7_SELML|nr:hypothetical protein SELMODRAFT_409177 [Selaginella moellendorffii]